MRQLHQLQLAQITLGTTLPNCRCSGNDIPGKFCCKKQLVFLTFDDAVAIQNIDFYREVLFHRRNPNNETITATFFITHEYTNYGLVHELYRRNHDIALHSMTHNPLTAYWASLNATMWQKEVVDQREQLSNFARVPPTAAIQGLRAPFLQIGGDPMYNVLKQGGFKWECSRPTLNFRKPGLWPYTNDYLSHQDCQIQPCPVGEYKGFWTVPMLDMIGDNNAGCAMVDTCTPGTFGIYTHAAWLNGTDDEGTVARKEGYIRFLDYLGTKNDVYIVGISQALEWVKNPTPLDQIPSSNLFKNPTRP
ncbi:Chitooligosaccharide deacetylase [Orchesella cincta]|uniref:Chitooligosaccharide deacetylase n=1 Tax=Orchesella cincta TaxID=48709 RepID=A0A1D2M532_ORCCI|nr:Chitooligosaccharide deacetylase [Orchesella cincta]